MLCLEEISDPSERTGRGGPAWQLAGPAPAALPSAMQSCQRLPLGFLLAVCSAAHPAASAGPGAGSGPLPVPPGTSRFPGNASHPGSWHTNEEEELQRCIDASPALHPKMVSGQRHRSWVRFEMTDLTRCSLNEPHDPLGDAHLTDYGGSDNATGTNSVPEHVQLENAQSEPTVNLGGGHSPRDKSL